MDVANDSSVQDVVWHSLATRFVAEAKFLGKEFTSHAASVLIKILLL